MMLQRSSADFGALQILEDANRAALLFGDTAQAGDVARVLAMSAVGKIQTGDIHAEEQEIAQNRFVVAGRADGADDLGAAVWRWSYV